MTADPTLSAGSTKLENNGWIQVWEPENEHFWNATGRKIAYQNLTISIAALLLAFVVWMAWSTVVVQLPNIGFPFSTEELFWLVALPGLSGATLRIFYSFMIPVFGGRNWTVLTTASLLVPAVGMALAIQNPGTPYSIFLVLALLSGFGGGNFASSMSNISFFFPKAKKGFALGLNGGLGNLGVSAVQFVVPIVITSPWVALCFGPFGKTSQSLVKDGITQQVWLQNAAWIWVPFILLVTIAAWFGMHNLAVAKGSFRDQMGIFKCKHNWLTGCLYTGSFGSFIGYSAALPLLIKTEFPELNPLQYAFIGPLVGALARPIGGWLADRMGGARVTLLSFLAMSGAVAGVLYFITLKNAPYGFGGFLGMFILLFFTAGIGNGSTYRMVPVIFQNPKQSAAVLGFISALAAYGAFIVPKSFGYSLSLTGGAQGAFIGFLGYYLFCVLITWWFYARKNAMTPC
ncbi:MAG: nitrate/nitrite transporter [Bdellovibrionales bacterium GWB1_55_8]|nr:MAG: nitrate/nitrite transporter [Bdellovibrionales bacterium GWB1_55_8]